MKIYLLLGTALSLGLVACGGKKAHIENVGPRISEGFYTVDSTDDKMVPGLIVRKEGGKVYAYSLYQYRCGETVTLALQQTSVAYSETTSKVSGPNVKIYGLSECELKTDLVLETDTSLLVKVIWNGVTQETYKLSSVSQDVFVAKTKSLALGSEQVSITEGICNKLLGSSCTDLGIRITEQ